MEFIKYVSSKKAVFKTSSGYKIKRVTEENRQLVLTRDEGTLYKRYKYSAEEREYKFELSTNSFKRLIYSNCYYCGIEPKQIHGQLLYNGIDRLDNNKGYNSDNCLACCKVCNRGKSTMNSDEFTAHCVNIATTLYPQMKAFMEGDLELAKQLRLQHLINSGVMNFDLRKNKEEEGVLEMHV